MEIKVKIKLNTLEQMLKMKYAENKSEFCRRIKLITLTMRKRPLSSILKLIPSAKS